ncbi:DUF2855 family protein [Alteromonas antoniana]|uniref:DUF2855 family protein n=1 Tax=Alteromonas antoniana TaxID=2803813 RepID=UPI001C469CCA|nr:DUF2855 family protein [Alteromonas antoniana]
MSTITNTRLLSSKSNVGNTRVDHVEESVTLEPGEALLTIDTFALTTNNITYAAFGESMRYWDFFPTHIDGWGQMPVWGYATVYTSNAEGIAVGDRFYGYYPIAKFLKIKAGRVNTQGFKEVSEHRKELPFTYNTYVRVPQTPTLSPDLEDAEMLMRPLFYTSYMLADFLQDNNYFGAKKVVFSSASSKTAYGTAYCGRKLGDHPHFVGITSARNQTFVESTGLYDSTVTYEELNTLSTDEPYVYVDFSGSNSLRLHIHQHLGQQLKYDCYAGSATNTEFLANEHEFNPEPVPYFAPDQIRKRIQDWGMDELNRRYETTQAEFLAELVDPQTGWMTLSPGYGFGDAARVTRTLYMTGDQPHLGRVIRFDMF